jgi:hypothetical protein
LLQHLPELPDDTPLDGGDVYGALEDIAGEAPDEEDDYFDLEDEEFLAGLGVPADEVRDPWSWGGWTAGVMRRAIARIAQQARTRPEKLLARAREQRGRQQDKDREECKRLQQEAARLARKLRAEEERLRLRRILPDAPTLDKVMRYEAHLSRQMLQALHTLERLQAARAGAPVPAPVAVDVTVSGPAPPSDEGLVAQP